MITLDEPLWQFLRPEVLEDFIGYQGQLRPLLTLSRGVVLFTGPIGCGKTSAALALCRKVLGQPVPNGGYALGNGVYAGHWHARDFDVEMLRNTSTPIFHNRAILLVDEAHELSDEKKSRIQAYIERAGQNNLVCLCTSEPLKIPHALQSRCTRKVVLGPLAGDDRRSLALRGWKARGMEDVPPDALFTAFDRYARHTPGRDILSAVDLLADGCTPQEAVRSVRTITGFADPDAEA